MIYVFPCYMFGMAAKSVGENCWVCGCAYLIPLVNLCARVHIRGKIREEASVSVSAQILAESMYHILSILLTEMQMLVHFLLMGSPHVY